ncbi:hypothetical protein PBY51_001104 [Eleginops maclovinus]|uniref:Uncharacterized protein n=1 Tax=Eleginops maclovinus TaxID=56733 RepID=A0AAN7XN62_ELEMC|nr:hypothetical protein PBY51_001104 [Eleginops maclovinus]
MSVCCVSGCENKHSSSKTLKFFRIPTGSKPFQANRRRLWLRKLREVNGEDIKANARVCSAHFLSNEASLEHNSPDFVPCVFTKESRKRRVTRAYTSRKRLHPVAEKTTEEETTSPRSDSPEDLQSSDLFEEMRKSPALQEESLTEEAETETTSSPNKTAAPFKAPRGVLKPKIIPIVLLKRVFLPAGVFKCEQCDQNFTNEPQLMRHKKLHEEQVAEEEEEEENEEEEEKEEEENQEEEREESASFVCESCGKIFPGRALFSEHRCEPSFPCNMCDRAFATSQNLKRHKLQHVRDDRKCQECGAMYCGRHAQPVTLLVAESAPVCEEDSPAAEPETDLMSVKEEAVPPVSLPKLPLRLIPQPLPLTPPPVTRLEPHLCGYPQTFIKPPPPPPVLPPSMQLFSPRFLTSALLQVDRNYDYMLSKPMPVKKKIVKEEPRELPLVLPAVISVENIKKERTAYDMEFAI